MKRLRDRPTPPARTKAYITHERLGLALGRASMTWPAFHLALMSGFTRASHEAAAGKKLTDEEVGAELAAAELELRGLHASKKTKAKTIRSNRRKHR